MKTKSNPTVTLAEVVAARGRAPERRGARDAMHGVGGAERN